MLLLTFAGALNNLFLALVGFSMIVIFFIILLYKYESYKQNKQK